MRVRINGPVGPYCEIIEVPSPENPSIMVRLGVRQDTFQRQILRGRGTVIAQYYGIIQDGLVIAAHAFRGLKRPLSHGSDMNADESVLIYAWRPRFDYEWVGYRHDGQEYRRDPPLNRVFVVLVREEPQPNEFHVLGSVEHWNWVPEDSGLKQAPIDWEKRYQAKLWSRETL
jgi:hypothetical protein